MLVSSMSLITAVEDSGICARQGKGRASRGSCSGDLAGGGIGRWGAGRRDGGGGAPASRSGDDAPAEDGARGEEAAGGAEAVEGFPGGVNPPGSDGQPK